MKFNSNNWDGLKNGINLSQKVFGKIKPDTPINNKIQLAQKQLQDQITRLNGTHEKLMRNHDHVFSKIVEAKKTRNDSRAKAYAIELQEIRKIKNVIGETKLAMEQIQLRLKTVSELGDVVVTLSPCMSIIKGLAPSITNLVPGINNSMQYLSSVLGDMMTGSSISPESTLTPYVGNADTTKILEEAHAIVEGQTKESIPEPPVGFTEGGSKEKSSMI